MSHERTEGTARTSPGVTPMEVAVCPSLPKLLLSFLRLGLTAFGGPAMVVHIRELAVSRRRWLT
jgi:hypothetical protein